MRLHASALSKRYFFVSCGSIDYDLRLFKGLAEIRIADWPWLHKINRAIEQVFVRSPLRTTTGPGTPSQTTSVISWACRNASLGIAHRLRSGHRFLREPRANRRVMQVRNLWDIAIFTICITLIKFLITSSGFYGTIKKRWMIKTARTFCGQVLWGKYHAP
jgi:hypothetical protein